MYSVGWEQFSYWNTYIQSSLCKYKANELNRKAFSLENIQHRETKEENKRIHVQYATPLAQCRFYFGLHM